MHRLGIDLGGTKIEGVVLDESGAELLRKRTSTKSEKGYAAILEKIRELYESLLQGSRAKLHTLGVGTPGALSVRSGLLKNSNTTCMNGKPVKKDLEELLGRGFAMENDANCFALAEAKLGAAQGKRVVFGVILGTGCGGGIVVDGKIAPGLQHVAGEWGHMAIDPAGPECYCGSRGCVETFISGGGLERRWRVENGEAVSLKELLEKYRKGDPDAAVFMSGFFSQFGRAMANLINVLDPDVVVLGGGVSNIHELYTKGVEEVGRQVFSDTLETPIVRNKLGDSAGVLGAALLGT